MQSDQCLFVFLRGVKFTPKAIFTVFQAHLKTMHSKICSPLAGAPCSSISVHYPFTRLLIVQIIDRDREGSRFQYQPVYKTETDKSKVFEIMFCRGDCHLNWLRLARIRATHCCLAAPVLITSAMTTAQSVLTVNINRC